MVLGARREHAEGLEPKSAATRARAVGPHANRRREDAVDHPLVAAELQLALGHQRECQPENGQHDERQQR
jgi:hypothetical protein